MKCAAPGCKNTCTRRNEWGVGDVCSRPVHFDEARADLPAADTAWDRDLESQQGRDELFELQGRNT